MEETGASYIHHANIVPTSHKLQKKPLFVIVPAVEGLDDESLTLRGIRQGRKRVRGSKSGFYSSSALRNPPADF